jgi:hypothetical protein
LVLTRLGDDFVFQQVLDPPQWDASSGKLLGPDRELNGIGH